MVERARSPQEFDTTAARDGVRRMTSPTAEDIVAAFGAARPERSEAKVTVDFANVPSGTRVRTDPQNTAHVDLSVGYQLAPLW